MKRMRRGRGRREVRERKRLACTVNSAREKTDAMTTTKPTMVFAFDGKRVARVEEVVGVRVARAAPVGDGYTACVSIMDYWEHMRNHSSDFVGKPQVVEHWLGF